MDQISVLGYQSVQLSVRVRACVSTKDEICNFPYRWHTVPAPRKLFHSGHTAKAVVAPKHFIAAQSRENYPYPSFLCFTADYVCIQAVDGGLVHGGNGLLCVAKPLFS